MFGRSILLFDGVDREQLAALGEVRTPSIADLFVAVMGEPAAREARHEHPSTTCRAACDASRVAGRAGTRPFYWSVRRELWENRSIYIAPLAVAALCCSAS